MRAHKKKTNGLEREGKGREKKREKKEGGGAETAYTSFTTRRATTPAGARRYSRVLPFSQKKDGAEGEGKGRRKKGEYSKRSTTLLDSKETCYSGLPKKLTECLKGAT